MPTADGLFPSPLNTRSLLMFTWHDLIPGGQWIAITELSASQLLIVGSRYITSLSKPVNGYSLFDLLNGIKWTERGERGGESPSSINWLAGFPLSLSLSLSLSLHPLTLLIKKCLPINANCSERLRRLKYGVSQWIIGWVSCSAAGWTIGWLDRWLASEWVG